MPPDLSLSLSLFTSRLADFVFISYYTTNYLQIYQISWKEGTFQEYWTAVPTLLLLAIIVVVVIVVVIVVVMMIYHGRRRRCGCFTPPLTSGTVIIIHPIIRCLIGMKMRTILR